MSFWQYFVYLFVQILKIILSLDSKSILYRTAFTCPINLSRHYECSIRTLSLNAFHLEGPFSANRIWKHMDACANLFTANNEANWSVSWW
jgi:hypothetical protein